jgi:hypothetical protein
VSMPADIADALIPISLPRIGHDGFSSIHQFGTVIDTEHLARMTLGDRKLEREVLGLFVEQAEMLIGRMANESVRNVAGFSHVIAGSARGIGAWRVAAAAEALERIEKTPEISFDTARRRLLECVTEAKTAIVALIEGCH